MTRKEYLKQYHLNNKERLNIYRKKYYLKNKNRIKKKIRLYNLKNKEIKILYYLNNKEKIKEKKRLYYLKHIERFKKYSLTNKEKIRERSRLFRLNKPHIQNSINANRRASKLKATPKFANLNKIREIYKNCPKGYVVDHIVPLQGKVVCGLHVEWNLQYLTSSDNLFKSNKLIT